MTGAKKVESIASGWLAVPTKTTAKMTTERLNEISMAINLALCTNGAVSLQSVNPTVQELLAFANQEPKFTAELTPCGHTLHTRCSFCPPAPEEDDEWEEEMRREKERDELMMMGACEREEETTEEEEEKPNICWTCGSECVRICQDGTEDFWLCEVCYYGNPDDDSSLYWGGEYGTDWNESGYCD